VAFPEPRLFAQRGNFGINQITFELSAIGSEAGKPFARIVVTVEDTRERELVAKSWQLKALPEGLPFSHFINDATFRAFMLKKIDAASGSVEFADKRKLFVGERLVYQVAAHRAGESAPVKLEGLTLPVPNFLEKIGMELGITKKTVFAVFRGIDPVKKALITTNPEGFINEFYKALRSIYADHIADELEFYLDEAAREIGAVRGVATRRTEDFELDGPVELFFPPTKEFAGTELEDADRRFMYKRVQVDSDVERSFIAEVVMQDPKVLLYFKFPARFKLLLPSIISNYNPDWGIIRKDEDGLQTLHLVRETKGQEDVRKLRFEHEKRKIVCARKYFDMLGIDYRPISATTTDWWKSEASPGLNLPPVGDMAAERAPSYGSS
ncbi:MAG TPA: hypothetical protein VMV44_06490, partial [Rectinemataceae bacterium]|nr:hypothetical protein [Rectinemataceae bacterium]